MLSLPSLNMVFIFLKLDFMFLKLDLTFLKLVFIFLKLDFSFLKLVFIFLNSGLKRRVFNIFLKRPKKTCAPCSTRSVVGTRLIDRALVGDMSARGAVSLGGWLCPVAVRQTCVCGPTDVCTVRQTCVHGPTDVCARSDRRMC